jgi:hypothetical protein
MRKLLLVLFYFIFSLISGCSSKPTPKASAKEAKAVMAEPVWFNAPDRFKVETKMGAIPTHPFFDLTSFRTKESTELSYFLVTPKNSDHLYEMDMVSGKKYRKLSYCKQKDIWESYSGEINKPNFAQGIVARLLDSTSRPQKIWVFGDEDRFFSSKQGDRDQSQRAKVVGGVVLQFCQNYPCKTGTGWTSQLILVAVNPNDSSMKEVENLEQLKKKIDWEYTVAFAQNGFGRSTNGPEPQPASRLVSEVPPKKALDFVFNSGHEFSFEEINSLRKNCFYLYDYIWRSQAKVRSNMLKKKVADDKMAMELKNRAKKIRDIRKFQLQTVFSDNLRYQVDEDEKKEVKKQTLMNFGRFYNFLLTRYGERLRTCMKFVRPASIQESRDRTWFFAFLNNWLNLEDLEKYYACDSRTWLKNPRLGNGRRRFDINKRSVCSSEAIDFGFNAGINVMASLAGSSSPHYKFIEYDYGIGGSHELLFAWVPQDGKKLGCNARELEEKSLLFPADVSWKDFNPRVRRDRYDTIR